MVFPITFFEINFCGLSLRTTTFARTCFVVIYWETLFGSYSDRKSHPKDSWWSRIRSAAFWVDAQQNTPGRHLHEGPRQSRLPPSSIRRAYPDTTAEPFQHNARPCARESVWIISSARRNWFRTKKKKKRQISLLPSIFTKCKYTSHKTKMTKNKSSRLELELHETNDINKSISAGLPVQKKANIND